LKGVSGTAIRVEEEGTKGRGSMGGEFERRDRGRAREIYLETGVTKKLEKEGSEILMRAAQAKRERDGPVEGGFSDKC